MLAACGPDLSYLNDLSSDVFLVTYFGDDVRVGDEIDVDTSSAEVRTVAVRNGWLELDDGRFFGCVRWSGGGGGPDEAEEIGEHIAVVDMSPTERAGGVNLTVEVLDAGRARSLLIDDGIELCNHMDRTPTDLSVTATTGRAEGGLVPIEVELSSVDGRFAYGAGVSVELGPGLELAEPKDSRWVSEDGRFVLRNGTLPASARTSPFTFSFSVAKASSGTRSFVNLRAVSWEVTDDPNPADNTATVTIG